MILEQQEHTFPVCIPPDPGEPAFLRGLLLHAQRVPVAAHRRGLAHDSGVLCAGKCTPGLWKAISISNKPSTLQYTLTHIHIPPPPPHTLHLHAHRR